MSKNNSNSPRPSFASRKRLPNRTPERRRLFPWNYETLTPDQAAKASLDRRTENVQNPNLFTTTKWNPSMRQTINIH